MNEKMILISGLRKVFKNSEKSQTEIAKMTNVTSAYIWKILNKENVAPRDLFIKSVCREFNVNEEWLRTGKGDMYIEISEEDEYFKAATSISKEDDKSAMDAIIKYWKLDSASKKAIWDFVHSLSKK